MGKKATGGSGTATPTMGVTVTNPTSSPNSLVATHGAPSAGTLVTYDVDYRVVGAGSYTRFQTGATAVSVTITGLAASTNYEVLLTPHVLIDGVGVTGTGTTAAAPTSFNILESSGANAVHQLNTVASLLAGVSQAGNVLTCYSEVVNDTDHTQEKIGFGIISGAEVSGTMRVQVRMGGDNSNQGGTWVDVLWGGSTSVTVVKVPVYWSSGDDPTLGRYTESSLVTLPSPLAPGASCTFRCVCDTSAANSVVPYGEGIYFPAWTITPGYPKIGAGNAITGTVPTLATFYGPSIGVGKIVWGRTAAAPIREIIFLGDSTTAMFGGAADRKGWQYFANQMARAGGKAWRCTGLGISGNGSGVYGLRAQAAVALCAATGRTMAMQTLSWNDNNTYDACIAELATVKAACDAAGVPFFVFLTSPPGSENPAAADPWLVPLAGWKVTVYNSTLATLQTTYAGKFLDMTPGIKTGNDYTKTAGLTNSPDDVHAKINDSTEQLGQYRMAMNLYAAMDALLAGL